MLGVVSPPGSLRKQESEHPAPHPRPGGLWGDSRSEAPEGPGGAGVISHPCHEEAA